MPEIVTFAGRATALALVLGGLPACEVIAGYEHFEGQTQSMQPADPPEPPHPCDPIDENKPDGETVLQLTKTSDGNCFWIDRTEVTVAQYRAYLQDEADAPLSWTGDDEVHGCGSWKVERSDPENHPEDDCGARESSENDPFDAQKPIRCVDWCDAVAYCRWANKELCGSRAPITNVTTSGSNLDWAAACSKAGASYPYGKSFEDGKCNIGLDLAHCTFQLFQNCGPTSVPSPLDCASPFGVEDMIGNVAEWTATCGIAEQPQDVKCTVKGGSFADDKQIACNSVSAPQPRSARLRDVGFRCCDQLLPGEAAMKRDPG